MRHALDALNVYLRWTLNRPGMCLWEVQEAFQAPHVFPRAIDQWEGARFKHRDRDIPLGAPVFWSNPGKAGHIAIYAGRGLVRSSDAGGRGRMGTRPLDWFVRNWYPRGEFLGWTEDTGGVLIPGLTPATYLGKLRFGQQDSDSVRNLQRALNGVKLPGGSTLPVTGNYGPKTDHEVRLHQRTFGFGNDPAGGSFVGLRQAVHLRLPGIR